MSTLGCRRRFVVIVNYQTATLVTRLVESLSGEPIDRIVVVDNDSPSASEAIALALLASQKTSLDIVLAGHNGGFGSGVNIGVDSLDLQERDVLWILNPDTVVHHGALVAMEAALGDDVRRIVSPTLLSGESGQDAWFSGGWVDIRGFRVVHAHDVAPVSGRERIPFVPATAIMMTGRTWRELGGMREDFFMYWEDVDLCLRARKLMIEVAVAPGALVRHAEGASSSSDGGRSRLYYYYVNRNRALLGRELFAGWKLLWGWKLTVTVGMLSTPFRREGSDRFGKTVSALCGLISGLSVRR